MNLHTLELNRVERYLAEAPLGLKVLIVAAGFGAFGLIVGSAGAVVDLVDGLVDFWTGSYLIH